LSLIVVAMNYSKKNTKQKEKGAEAPV
jgi:hypothetical protein